ncbi:hypothetical protein HanXRQr2_Chr01g0033891 [Helianthus annuus]|uniref:Uncharacterized protein n=1 Tax=Helianthus annuus TaxID=4232 RepID=A0A251VRS7_HELAN|nr:hypothetical protein HanXRQr2_Chr01g0033891 [Helianthus annuus]
MPIYTSASYGWGEDHQLDAKMIQHQEVRSAGKRRRVQDSKPQSRFKSEFTTRN